ncbi:uncharacterized protein AC631_05420 [Debaryomyces fabryi]|uniref:Uncharacterized protein n=1 Tax=Debaryomyces fabryi TaxID=58627 RepID=A0A0V1PRF9_9ASCO|nr:uncharacterized protein AC631_05420 [Debaryomyces fabryi]KRZ98819.1 hypothetical protein AC631_05420 [Debaryomyces fabryi]CUM45488.1 unnamed protein product [Debaryomyces fabryi]
MSTKKEREVILNSLEDEYRHDLSIHLYSTFLFHQINPLFPRRNWASWPLPFERVPDPQSSKTFVDSEICIDQFDDIDHETNVNREINLDITKQELTDDEDESEDNGDYEEITTKDEVIPENKHQRYMRIRSVATRETLSNSKVDIMIELHALLEKKIHDKLKAVADKKHLTMSPDISSKMTNEVCKKLANKVDHLVNNIIKFQKQGQTRLSSSRPYPRLLNWQDILLAGLDVDESHNKILKNTNHTKLYQKCERLFNKPKYTYEYDDEEDDNHEDEDNIPDTYIINPGPDEQTPRTDIRLKPQFDFLEYLSRVEETHSGLINYQNFKERVLKNRTQEEKLKEIKKEVFMGKLRLQSKYSNIDWNEGKKRPNFQDRRAPKKFRIQNEDKDSQKEDALAHGGIQLTTDDFTVNI